jgi:hypothetical protein
MQCNFNAEAPARSTQNTVRQTQKQHDTSLPKMTQNDHDAAVISDMTFNTATNR